jgi:DNA-binding GntR family transcriptional regulator
MKTPGIAAAPIRSESLADQTLRALKEEIVAGRLLPGQRVNLAAYQEHWQLSMTPLRDAAKRLEDEGLVTIRPRKGIYVAEVDETELQEIFDIRQALEPLATRLAAPFIAPEDVDRLIRAYQDAGAKTSPEERERALGAVDSALHDLVLDHCPNRRLVDTMRRLWTSIMWCLSVVPLKVPHALEHSLEEHLAVLHALRDGDAEAAAEQMRVHLERTNHRLAEAIRQD